MNTNFTERVRFNQLEDGEEFTFRKGGIIKNYYQDVLMRFDSAYRCNGEWIETNILTDYGTTRINNLRAFVWRAPRTESKNTPHTCTGCINAWMFPAHEKCKYCSRRYVDNYVKKES